MFPIGPDGRSVGRVPRWAGASSRFVLALPLCLLLHTQNGFLTGRAVAKPGLQAMQAQGRIPTDAHRQPAAALGQNLLVDKKEALFTGVTVRCCWQ